MLWATRNIAEEVLLKGVSAGNRNRRNGDRNRRGWGGVDTINVAIVVDLASLGIVIYSMCNNRPEKYRF